MSKNNKAVLRIEAQKEFTEFLDRALSKEEGIAFYNGFNKGWNKKQELAVEYYLDKIESLIGYVQTLDLKRALELMKKEIRMRSHLIESNKFPESFELLYNVPINEKDRYIDMSKKDASSTFCECGRTKEQHNIDETADRIHKCNVFRANAKNTLSVADKKKGCGKPMRRLTLNPPCGTLDDNNNPILCNKCLENTKNVINSQEGNVTEPTSRKGVQTIEGRPDIHSQNKELLDKDYAKTSVYTHLNPKIALDDFGRLF